MIEDPAVVCKFQSCHPLYRQVPGIETKRKHPTDPGDLSFLLDLPDPKPRLSGGGKHMPEDRPNGRLSLHIIERVTKVGLLMIERLQLGDGGWSQGTVPVDQSIEFHHATDRFNR